MKKDHLLLNKIFGGLITGGLAAFAVGFIATTLVPVDSQHMAANAYPINIEAPSNNVVATSGGGGDEDIMALIAEADVARGKKLSKKCSACHSFNDGGAHKIGPNLHNIVDKPKGSKNGYSYSAALMEKGGDWDAESLNLFFIKPKKYIAGTKMNFAGFKKAKDRAAMIKYLQSLK